MSSFEEENKVCESVLESENEEDNDPRSSRLLITKGIYLFETTEVGSNSCSSEREFLQNIIESDVKFGLILIPSG